MIAIYHLDSTPADRRQELDQHMLSDFEAEQMADEPATVVYVLDDTAVYVPHHPHGTTVVLEHDPTREYARWFLSSEPEGWETDYALLVLARKHAEALQETN